MTGGRRKSNCVTEVEKIKAKREQRRAQHQAIREHVEETYDTSNPNWEFLQMIRYEISSFSFFHQNNRNRNEISLWNLFYFPAS